MLEAGYEGVAEMTRAITQHITDGKEIFHALIRAKSGVHIGRVDWFGPEVTMRERTRVMTGQHRREADQLFGFSHHQFTEVNGDVREVERALMETGEYDRERARKLDIGAFTAAQYATAWREVGKLQVCEA